ncbi:DNA/RNA nuclease SfsA [Pararhodobacter oceanensis]|uniref:Sugar fermentation stimulation protein homolog n=1 Tax=Pararhodobacter oceanensis TaxID=2172121 RepID=A0A2T8HSE2_9RHOB|nr:DNA/RNA nuclease SfsA [Pararhodobacter oceanensis]PVH28327.1 DNA/RNA nuclease SfsA [Pararhodobacter oceanensis]
MEFTRPLIRAKLLRRYKRFLADMEMDSGEVITAHCANPGSMLGMNAPGLTCWLEGNDDPKRKLRWSWKLVEVGEGLVVVDTAIANRVVGEALRADAVPGVSAGEFRAEVKMGQNSRVDFQLGDGTLLEVKSVTLARDTSHDGWAEFPDSVTARGTKHLLELTEAARQGRPAAMLYLLARNDVHRIRIAADIDPTYAQAFDIARAAGVRMLGLGCQISTTGIHATGAVLIDPAPQTGKSR